MANLLSMSYSKPMTLKIIDTGKASAQDNMDLDAQLLKDLKDDPVLHIYEWEEPSATYGHFINPSKYLNTDQIQLGKRPTGGGIIFHVSDWAFSVLVPSSHPKFSLNTLDNYRLINDAVKAAVQKFLSKHANPHLLQEEPTPLDESCRHFCMAKPTVFDVMLGKRKIAGSAQRRVKQGFLHQGSICIAHPDPNLLKSTLLPGTAVFDAMQQNTFSLLGPSCTPSELSIARTHIKTLLTEALQKDLAE